MQAKRSSPICAAKRARMPSEGGNLSVSVRLFRNWILHRCRRRSYMADSHKVYYGIFISIGISGTCTKMLGVQANWLCLEASRQRAHGRSGARIFQRGNAALECAIAGIAMERGNRGDMDDRAVAHDAHRTEFQCAK